MKSNQQHSETQTGDRPLRATPDSQTANRDTASDQILNWFDQYLREHRLAIGDPLPSEDTIVQETQMSRTSVREALTRLRTLGVVESRRKRGMRLTRSPALLELARLLSSNRLEPDLVGHVGSLRSALEMGFESEIFKRCTPENAAELRRIYQAMVVHASEPDLWNDLDREFHETMIRITGNKLAIWLSQLFQPFFDVVRSHVSSMSDTTRERHRRIVAALENRDSIAFHHAMREHHVTKLSYDNYDNRGHVEPSAAGPAPD